jgi:hypothetical protein
MVTSHNAQSQQCIALIDPYYHIIIIYYCAFELVVTKLERLHWLLTVFQAQQK